jgi:hypothetical protein
MEKQEKNLIIIFLIFLVGLHNKPQGCGASVASAAGPFNKKKSPFPCCVSVSYCLIMAFKPKHLTMRSRCTHNFSDVIKITNIKLLLLLLLLLIIIIIIRKESNHAL